MGSLKSAFWTRTKLNGQRAFFENPFLWDFISVGETEIQPPTEAKCHRNGLFEFLVGVSKMVIEIFLHHFQG